MIHDYQVGDSVELSVKGKITRVFEDAVIIDGAWLVDKPHIHHVTAQHHRKAAAGEVISGRRFKHTWWKRGTVIRIYPSGGGEWPDSMLLHRANFISAEGFFFDFDLIADDDLVELLAVPQ